MVGILNSTLGATSVSGLLRAILVESNPLSSFRLQVAFFTHNRRRGCSISRRAAVTIQQQTEASINPVERS